MFAIFNKTKVSTPVTYRRLQRESNSSCTGLPGALQSTRKGNRHMDVWLCIALFHPFFCCQLIKMWSVPSLSCLYSPCWALSLLPFLSLPAKKRRVPQLVPHPALPSKPFSCCVSRCILGQPSAVNLTHLPVAGVAFPPSSLHSSQAVLVPPSFIFFSSATALPFAPTLSLIFFNGILGSRTVPQECPGSVLLCFCFVFFLSLHLLGFPNSILHSSILQLINLCFLPFIPLV